MSLFQSIAEFGRRAYRALAFCTPAVDLLLRLWVAGVFFRSGLTKIQSWDTTILLFTNEYHVPFLSPEAAAFAGTATELVMPVFLVLGLGGRLAAAVLFVFNIIAVISYPELGDIGIQQHQVWGIMLLVILLHGPGKLAIDHLIARWLGRRQPAGRGRLAPV